MKCSIRSRSMQIAEYVGLSPRANSRIEFFAKPRVITIALAMLRNIGHDKLFVENSFRYTRIGAGVIHKLKRAIKNERVYT